MRNGAKPGGLMEGATKIAEQQETGSREKSRGASQPTGNPASGREENDMLGIAQ
jgi:hypothetical protein